MGVQEGFQEGYTGCIQDYEGAPKVCKSYDDKAAHEKAKKEHAALLEKQRLDSAKANKGKPGGGP